MIGIGTLLLLIASLAAAQTPPADMPLTAVERAQIIEATAARVESEYVDEQKGLEFADAIRRAVKAGTFDEATSALKLVPLMNRVLVPFGDAHLRFGYNARPNPHPDAPETQDEHAQRLREAALTGFGVRGVQRLEGNVGLLTIVKFHDPAFAGDAIGAAMELLAPTNALIIDLRDSEGGLPEMVAYLMSYFFEGDPIHIGSIYFRAKNFTRQLWTEAYVRGPRYVGKEVYILTSKKTFSAAEAFTYHMKSRKRAAIVGEKTRGGANAGEWLSVHPNFAVFVPTARGIDPVTGKNWEHTGVEPDIVVAPPSALQTAHLRALRKLREQAKDAEARESLDWAIGRVENPPQ
jgi:hypothetical protein